MSEGRAFKQAKPLELGIYSRVVRPALYKTLRDVCKITHVKGIGSTGKASLMSDVDLVIETPLTRDQVHDALKESYGDNIKKFGHSMVTFLYEDRVQVDLIVGNTKYISWARAGASYRPAKRLVKGAIRNFLLNATLRVLSAKEFGDDGVNRTRYTLDFDRGLFLVKQTKQGKTGPLKDWSSIERTLIATDPDEIVRMIFGQPKLLAYYNMTFFEIVERVRDSSRTKEHAVEIYEAFLNDLSTIDPSSKAFGKHHDAVMTLIMRTINNDDG